MANTKAAKKSIKQNEKRRLKNLARRTAIKTAIKKVLIAVKENQDAAATQALLKNAAAQLARAKGKRVIHANTASRKLSRLAKRLKKAEKAS
ncbi:MAG: 30S ribosomal protein S20 [Candidatus Babeliaceae bacterium]